jgi:hypothetical protein
MVMSGKERQRKWQERQKTVGKKRVTIMMDKEALIILEHEKARTGESLSHIISRAVININKKVSDNEIAKCGRGDGAVVSDNELEKSDALKERIVTLIGVVGLSAEDVAERLTDEEIRPPCHETAWTADLVNQLYINSVSS